MKKSISFVLPALLLTLVSTAAYASPVPDAGNSASLLGGAIAALVFVRAFIRR